MTHIVTKPNHGAAITSAQDNPATALPELQLFFDDLESGLNNRLLGESIALEGYTVVSLPDPAKNKQGLIFVEDEVGGPVPAFSDEVNWRRVTDRAIVS